MKEASFSDIFTPEQIIEYCREIYNAETQEEIETIETEITEYLREKDYSEEQIQIWIQQIELVVDTIVKEERIIFNENGTLQKNETPTQEVIETNIPKSTSTDSQANTPASVTFGVLGAALVTGIALKKKVFKNKKNKTL